MELMSVANERMPPVIYTEVTSIVHLIMTDLVSFKDTFAGMKASFSYRLAFGFIPSAV